MSDSSDQQNHASSFLSRLRKSVETTLIHKSLPGGSIQILGQSVNCKDCEVNRATHVVTSSEVATTPTPPIATKYLPYILSQFDKILTADTIDMDNLRKISWNGVPNHHRPDVWKMLLGYVPLKRDRREETVKRKRKEYLDSIPLYFSSLETVDRTTVEGEIRRQILVDLPRTCPNNPFFHQLRVRQCMERILYIWSIRHPASGYVQGMNDLLTPLLIICAQSFMNDPSRTDFAALNNSTMVGFVLVLVSYHN
jgi:hypothetical protein